MRQNCNFSVMSQCFITTFFYGYPQKCKNWYIQRTNVASHPAIYPHVCIMYSAKRVYRLFCSEL